MKSPAKFIAIDLGASSGRVMSAQWDEHRFILEELYRFSNWGVRIGDRLYWDVLNIWSQIQVGMAKYRADYRDSPDSIGIDAWGIDFGLLDQAGRLIGNPVHYRDARTYGIPELLFAQIPEVDLFTETGVQAWHINTLFQLYSMVLARDSQLQCADTLLTIPDLFLYFLSGAKGAEYTEATTTQMYSALGKDWASRMLTRLGIPVDLLPAIVQPGSVRGLIRRSVLENCGFDNEFPAVAVASHDTASAVAAIPGMDADSAFISSGTWSLMGVEVDEPDTSPDTLRSGFTNEGGVDGGVLLLKNLTGLWIVQECLRHWVSEGRAYTWSELVSAAETAKPFQCHIDPDALCFQSQCDMPNAIRQYCKTNGETIPETVGAIVRCAFESLSLKYRSVLESLRRLTGRKLDTIRIAGGGCLNTALCQMTADACGCHVVSGPAEASALGNVMLQAVATGHLPDVRSGRTTIADSVRSVRFHPHRDDQWDEAYARFQMLEGH